MEKDVGQSALTNIPYNRWHSSRVGECAHQDTLQGGKCCDAQGNGIAPWIMDFGQLCFSKIGWLNVIDSHDNWKVGVGNTYFVDEWKVYFLLEWYIQSCVYRMKLDEDIEIYIRF